MRAIQREDRPATSDEQAVLARWSGWGAVPEVFDPARPEYAWARDELAALLTPEELAAAARNTLNAHYTDAALVQAIWTGVRQLGFSGGQVLEPGCGSGNFIAFAPGGVHVTGVELEPVTAAIAAKLYPDARILCESFAVTRASQGFFDLAIGNVPFGAIRLNDRIHNRGGHSIHGHFVIKGLWLTRPGGMVAVLTSRYTMDARNPAARREIAALADLVGAVRLPSGAHQRAAGTGVVTDLLIFRRREPGREPDGIAWEQARVVEVDGAQVPVNEYFLDHPARVLGELRAVHGAYRADDLVVTATGDVAPALAQALEAIAADATSRGLTWTAAPAASVGLGVVPPQVATAGPGAQPWATSSAEWSSRPDGYLRARADGRFTRVSGGAEVLCEVPRAQVTELRHLIGLRDVALALLDAEAASGDDSPRLGELRATLNTIYDAYLRAFGPLNRFSWRRTGRADPGTGEEKMARIAPPQGGFRADPFAPVVLDNWRNSTRSPSGPPRRRSSPAGSSLPATPGWALTRPPTRWRSAWTSAARSGSQ